MRITVSGSYPDARYFSLSVYAPYGAPFSQNCVTSSLPAVPAKNHLLGRIPELIGRDRSVLQEVTEQRHSFKRAARRVDDFRRAGGGNLVNNHEIVVTFTQFRAYPQRGRRSGDDARIAEDLPAHLRRFSAHPGNDALEFAFQSVNVALDALCPCLQARPLRDFAR